MIVRRDERSIFDAYNGILDETARCWPDLEGAVLVHEDVHIRDPRLETRLRESLAHREVGVVGVVGGKGHREMSWWKTDALYGHVEHGPHRDDFSRGEHDVDTSMGC